MNRVTKSFLFVPIVAVTLTACAADTGSNPNTDEIELTTTMPPASGPIDEFTWNLGSGEPASLDPSQTGPSNATVLTNLCENLLYMEPDYTASPGLAEVEQTDDTTYVVTLRPEAHFWNDSPVTADDAIWSIERLSDPALASTHAQLTSAVSGFKKLDDYSFEIHLSQPDIAFYGLLATSVGAVMDKEASEELGATLGKPDGGLMCSGPYELKEWSSGSRIVLERYADYWNTDRAALNERVTFSFNTDVASSTAAMKNGEIQGMFEFPASAFNQLTDTTGTVSLGLSQNFYTMNFVNVEDGPLADERVRKALQLAIDYSGIKEGPMLGMGDYMRALVPTVSLDYADQPAYEEYLSSTYVGTQDLEAAKQLIDEAGKPTEAAVLSYGTYLPELAQVAVAIESAGKAIGVPIEIKPLPVAQLDQLIFYPDTRPGTDIIIDRFLMDLPPEPTTWYRKYLSGYSFNMSGLDDPEYDELVNRAIGTLDDAERAELILEAQQRLNDSVINVGILGSLTRTWVAEGITGVPTAGSYMNIPWAALVGSTE